jgi:hypothetical protein
VVSSESGGTSGAAPVSASTPPGRKRWFGAAEPGAIAFVWATWALLLVLDLGFVARYGADAPVWDDFDVVPVAIGERPLTVSWLWSQHNEHRVPLPRLVWLASYHLSAGDFRAGMVCSVVAMSLAAAGLLAVAGALRGGTAYSDAFFPLALLHWGHHATFLWSWEIVFALSTVFACVLLTSIATVAARDLRGATAAGACLALLPLCGASGVALVPALSLWLSIVAASQWRADGPSARVALGWTIAALFILLLYSRGYGGSARPATADGWGSLAKTTIEFLSLVVGPSAALLWPYSGLAVVAALALTGALLTGALVREPAERLRAFGLLCFLGAMISLAIGVAWGRTGTIRLAGFADRYVTLAVPLACAISLCWQIYGGAVSSRLVPMILLVGMCVLVWPNSRAGLEHGRANRASAASLRRDIDAGLPLYKLVRRYTPFLYPSQDVLEANLTMMRRHGIRQFAALRNNPRFDELPLPQRLAQSDSPLIFALPEARYLAGIRLQYSHANHRGPAMHFELAWRRDGMNGFPADRRYTNWLLPTGSDLTTTIWIDDVVKQVRIRTDDQPAELEIGELILLVPAAEPQARLDSLRAEQLSRSRP